MLFINKQKGAKLQKKQKEIREIVITKCDFRKNIIIVLKQGNI